MPEYRQQDKAQSGDNSKDDPREHPPGVRCRCLSQPGRQVRKGGGGPDQPDYSYRQKGEGGRQNAQQATDIQYQHAQRMSEKGEALVHACSDIDRTDTAPADKKRKYGIIMLIFRDGIYWDGRGEPGINRPKLADSESRH